MRRCEPCPELKQRWYQSPFLPQRQSGKLSPSPGLGHILILDFERLFSLSYEKYSRGMHTFLKKHLSSFADYLPEDRVVCPFKFLGGVSDHFQGRINVHCPLSKQFL